MVSAQRQIHLVDQKVEWSQNPIRWKSQNISLNYRGNLIDIKFYSQGLQDTVVEIEQFKHTITNKGRTAFKHLPESFQYEEREWEIRLGWKEWEEMEIRGRDEIYPVKYGRIVVWINGDCVDDFPRI